jgi:hypothetical protein
LATTTALVAVSVVAARYDTDKVPALWVWYRQAQTTIVGKKTSFHTTQSQENWIKKSHRWPVSLSLGRILLLSCCFYSW